MDEIACPRCLHGNILGDMRVFYDISCANCPNRFCGQCLADAHYPAYCNQNFLWENREQQLMNPRMMNRIQVCQNHLDLLDVINQRISVMQQEVFYFTHPFVIGRVTFPLTVIRDAARFLRWIRIHAVFMPSMLLRMDHQLSTLYTRIDLSTRNLQNWLRMGDDMWSVRNCCRHRLRIRIVRLAALHLEVNQELGIARVGVVPGLPSIASHRTPEELEQDEIAITVAVNYLTAALGIALLV